MTDTSLLGGQLVRQLQGAHAIKAGALRMFDPMLAAVAAERDGDEMGDVSDLLARMHGNFSEHREVTANHAGKLAARLEALGAGPSRARTTTVSAGAAARAGLGKLRGQNYGAAARDAFVFEHLEIATLRLLEELAERSGDSETAEIARRCRADDESMAATIDRNWNNVLTLTLASRGLPTLRPPEDEE